ncbi:hypothetical protein [Streptomyces sp. S.PNR 29]|uniref:hypothetical protein n=1 Tax=Streptomyces sp. S.PNR 29 TaxID=2973805 RepID=UPI0025AF36DE|nr:hypothetical protein [Streptomyces sp. S.PNR 29]MDN0199924.1 hypothetical protein [Streptomyces sp. S.PNR 29]
MYDALKTAATSTRRGCGGTLIRLKVAHLPGGKDPLPIRLWSSKTVMTCEDVCRKITPTGNDPVVVARSDVNA